MGTIKGKLAKGTLWLAAARGLTNLIGFCSTLLLARLLVPADFGLVALATTILTMLSAVTDLSLSSALIHHEDPQDDHFHTAWTLNFLRATGVGLLFCAAAYPAAEIYGEPRLASIMLVLGGSAVLGGLTNPKTVMFTRSLVFWQEFVLSVAQKLVGFITAAAIAFIYHSYWALVAGTVASQVVALAASYAVLPFRPRIAVVHARALWSFSGWLTLGRIVDAINWRFDYLLIGSFLGRPALGYYSVGDNLAVMPTREATAPLSQTLFPAFSRLSHDSQRLRGAYCSAQSLVTAIALPLGIGFALVAKPVVLLAMGEKWLPAVIVVQVLASIFALHTLGSAVQPLAMAKGETRLLFNRNLLIFVIRVPFLLLGMFLGGLPGVVYARAITGLTGLFINMRFVRQLIGLGLRNQLKANSRSLGSIAIMAAVVLSLQAWHGPNSDRSAMLLQTAIQVIAGAISYVGAHCALWLAVGCPPGPEAEFRRAAAGIVSRLRGSSPGDTAQL